MTRSQTAAEAVAEGRCPICGSGEAHFERRLSGSYNLWDCDACRGRFCYPFAAPQPDFYSRASDASSVRRHSVPNRWHTRHPARESNAFAMGQKGLLLDIGCGNGGFAAFAASVGYTVIGVDTDAVSIGVARNRRIPRAEFHCCTLDEFCRSVGETVKFDVVTMFEVLEHLDTPGKALRLVKEFLCERGLFVGSLPNIQRALMWRLHWEYELPPYHLTYWTAVTWAHFLSSHHGFEILRCEPSFYFGYVTDVLLSRMKVPLVLRRLIAPPFHLIEAFIERRGQCGAHFYFEAKPK